MDEKPLLTDEDISYTSDEHDDQNIIHNGSVTGHTPPYLKSKDEKVKAQPIRWYILLLFSFLAFMQNCVWNTWGPIAASAEFVFGWSDATIALMNNWGPISYVTSAFAFSWLMDVKGMRKAVVLTGVCIFFGTGLRCIPAPVAVRTWLVHLGQLLNGFAGPVVGAGPPLISSLWFPVNQRITATAIAASLGFIGTAVAFITGPLMISEVQNATACGNKSSEYYNESHCKEQHDHISSQIDLLMYIEFGIAVVLFLLILIYFPAKPKNSPSITASIKRTDFRSGILKLLKNYKFWMLTIPYAVSSGVFQCWSSVLDINLKPLHVKEDTAGWIGFWCTLSGQAAGMVIGIFADRFAKRMKLFLLTSYSIATVVFLVFTFACVQIIPFNTAILYATSIVGSICIFGTTALFYELGCEASYPVAEGLTNGAMTWTLNLVGLLFLLMLMIPHIGTVWMNWCLFASIGMCVPIFFFYKERYSRYDIDAVVTKVVNPES